MNCKRFNELLVEMQTVTVETLAAKATEYATDDDRLHNFKVAAGLQGVDPVVALGGMMAKHTVSVYDMIAATNDRDHFEVELWEEKIKDHINYLFLLWALIHEPQ